MCFDHLHVSHETYVKHSLSTEACWPLNIVVACTLQPSVVTSCYGCFFFNYRYLCYFILFPESFQDLLQLEDWTAKLTKLEVLLKLTGKFVYMYNDVLLILSTVTTLTCSQSTILEFPCRRMVQVCHLKNVLCLGTNFYTKYCCFLVCIWDVQLKRVCVENCRKLLHCWHCYSFIPSSIHSFILFIYLFT